MTEANAKRNRLLPIIVAIAVAAGVGGVIAVTPGPESQPQTTPRPADPGPAGDTPPSDSPVAGAADGSERIVELTLFVTSDQQCGLEDCGCQVSQEGGLVRRAALIRQYDAARSIVLDGGDMACAATGDLPGLATLKYEFMLRGMARLGAAALAVGGTEVRLPRDRLAQAARQSGLTPPFITANLRAAATGKGDGAGRPAPWVIVERAGIKVGITSAITPAEAAGADAGWTVDPAGPAVGRALRELRDGGADLRVVLVAGDESAARQLAADHARDADLIAFSGPAAEFRVRSLGPLPIGPDGGAPYLFRDGDDSRTQGVITVRVAAGADDGPGRLVSLRGTSIRLTTDFPTDPEITAMVRGPLRARAHDLERTAPVPARRADGDAHMPVSACAGCHSRIVDRWSETGHARAYQTLVETTKQTDAHLDPRCIGCHTQGYRDPNNGGFLVAAEALEDESFRDVACGNCHGYSKRHVDYRRMRSPQRATVQIPRPGKEVCRDCHYSHHDPGFDAPDNPTGDDKLAAMIRMCRGRRD
jgi:hypothetical protein